MTESYSEMWDVVPCCQKQLSDTAHCIFSSEDDKHSRWSATCQDFDETTSAFLHPPHHCPCLFTRVYAAQRLRSNLHTEWYQLHVVWYFPQRTVKEAPESAPITFVITSGIKTAAWFLFTASIRHQPSKHVLTLSHSHLLRVALRAAPSLNSAPTRILMTINRKNKQSRER